MEKNIQNKSVEMPYVKGLVNRSISSMDKSKKREKMTEKELKYLRDKDRQLVRGLFRYHECPGGELKFSTRFHKGDPIDTWQLMDGEIYTLPLSVAKHLVNNGWYPEYEHVPGQGGLKMGQTPAWGKRSALPMRVRRKVKRFTFESLEFVDETKLEHDESENLSLAQNLSTLYEVEQEAPPLITTQL